MATNVDQNILSNISTSLAKECKMYSTGYRIWHRKNKPNIPISLIDDEHLFVWENSTFTIFVRATGSSIVLFSDKMYSHPVKVIDLNDPNSIDKLTEFVKYRLTNVWRAKVST